MVLILVAAGLQLYRRPQVDRLFQRHAPLMLSGKPAVGAFLCTKPDEASGQLVPAGPERTWAVVREGDCGLALAEDLALMVDGPQVEKEARYEPVRCLEGTRERARNTKADVRRLHAPFHSGNSVHQSGRKPDRYY